MLSVFKIGILGKFVGGRKFNPNFVMASCHAFLTCLNFVGEDSGSIWEENRKG